MALGSSSMQECIPVYMSILQLHVCTYGTWGSHTHAFMWYAGRHVCIYACITTGSSKAGHMGFGRQDTWGSDIVVCRSVCVYLRIE
jgi:hypothetical protein